MRQKLLAQKFWNFLWYGNRELMVLINYMVNIGSYSMMPPSVKNNNIK
mgnify:FL=1